jgi:uncharacterized membrane protein
MRRTEVTRLEGFSDAVFGFALTLLVVSLEVPRNFEDLMTQMEGFVGFALMFAMVCWIWYEHNVYFRQFGVQDQWTVFLNSVLLFVVLFYVYPLKFLTSALMLAVGLGDPEGPRFDDPGMNGGHLMLLYSSGVVLIFGVFVLLYRHAWRRRDSLSLTAAELLSLRYGMRSHVISTSLGATSFALALALPSWAAIAGMMYALMGPLHAWNGYLGGKAQADLKAREEADAESRPLDSPPPARGEV